MTKYIFLTIIMYLISTNCNAEATAYSDVVSNSSKLETTIINNCKQNFNNVNVGGDVIMNCVTNIEKISDQEKQKIASLSEKMKKIKDNIKQIKNSNSLNKKDIKNNKNAIINLNRIYSEHEKQYKEKISSITSDINNLKIIIKKSKNIANDIKTIIEKKISNIKEINRESTDKIKELENSIDDNEDSILMLETKVIFLEDNVRFVMDEFVNGTLESISFYGPKIGLSKINNFVYNIIGFEYERRFNLKYNLFVDISMYDGEKESSYTTLNGLDKQVINEDNSFYTLSLGTRKFFKKNDNNYNWYIGGALGYATGDEKTLFENIFAGVELYKRHSKLSLELGCLHFHEITHQQVIFEPLGQSKNFQTKENELSIFLLLKYSIR